MPSIIVTPPAAEPISLDEARRFCRVDDDFADDDDLLVSLITSARQDAEKVTWRALVTQTWKAAFDRFPSPRYAASLSAWTGPQWGVMPGPMLTTNPEGKTGYEFFLPKPPLVTVNSIKYIGPDGVQQTLASSAYIVDAVSEPGRVTPAYGVSWPAIREQANAVEINFTCGYGAASAVPEGIKRWMRLRVATLYNNREEVAILARGKVEVLPYVDGLLDDYRVKSF